MTYEQTLTFDDYDEPGWGSEGWYVQAAVTGQPRLRDTDVLTAVVQDLLVAGLAPETISYWWFPSTGWVLTARQVRRLAVAPWAPG